MSGVTAQVSARVQALRSRYADRDRRMAEVQAVRRGRIESIAPGLFSEQWQRPIVANMIDTAARDTAAVLAPLPSFNCSAASGLNETAKKFADKRTKIVRSYISQSEFDLQMLRGADQYNSYGLLVLCVEPDFETNSPRLAVEDSIGAYPVWNSRGRTTELARWYQRDWFSLVADYPELERLKELHQYAVGPTNKVDVVKYVSDTRVLVYLPNMGDFVLEDVPNPAGKCYYVAVQRPGLDDEIRGAYDDVIWVQLARHRMQMLLMEGVDKAIRAPMVVTPDVTDIPTGPDAVITAQGGVNSVGRARLEMPNQAFAAIEQLKGEQQVGSMSPEARSGSIDASVVTGRGVQQLMAGFSAQISAAQTVFRAAFRRAIQLAFAMDEGLFGSMSKEIRGNDNGVPYSTTYTPKKDINGDHTVDITYGFAAGLDPNRALVFLLQADGAGIISKDYLRRNLPVDINAVEEERKLTVEASRQSILGGMAALAQAIPQMAASGGDPTQVLLQQAKFIKLIMAGKSVEDAAQAALAPEPPPAPAAPGVGPEGIPPPGGPGSEPGAGGVAIPAPEAGRPDLSMMMAGLSSTGQPNLQAAVSRQIPVGA